MKWPEDFINQIICGDCLEVIKDIPDKSIDLVLTDPPYAVPVVTGVAREGVKNYADLSISEGYFRILFEEFGRILKDAGAMFIFCDETFYPSVFRALYNDFDTKLLVWDKQQMGMGYHWRRGFELIVFAHRGKTEKKSADKLDIIKNKRVGNEEREHPAQKPISLISYLINNFTNENDIIFDSFLGSGTTAVACQALKRNFIGIEISEKYCEIAKQRLRQQILL